MREALMAALEAAGRGVGDTIIDPPAGVDPMQTGAASSFVRTPGGLGPGGVLAGTTPASMPEVGGPASASGSAPPLPLFTAPRMAQPAAPAMTPSFALHSLTPAGTSQASQPPLPITQSSSKTPKVAVAAVATLGVVLVLLVLGAVVLSREDRPAAAKLVPSATVEPTATVPSAVVTVTATATATATAITIGDPPASSAPPAASTTPVTVKPPAAVKTRTPPTTTAKNPLDQGRF
jgi:hypothetical protein